MMTTYANDQKRLGPILLAPGIRPQQIFVYLIVVAGCAFAAGFMNLMQPLILVQQLGVAQGQIGKLAGLLATTQQFATLLLVSSAGAWADTVGRRTLLIIALTGFSSCLVLFPALSAVWALFLVRFAWGAAFTGFTAGGATKVMDYPDNGSRGKFVSLVLVSQGILEAAFIAGVAAPLPGWLKGMGASAWQASAGAFWIVAGLVFAIALVAIFAMDDDSRRGKAGKVEKHGLRDLLAGSQAVLAHARKNPRLALILLIGFVIRSDGVVVASFLALWIVSAGRAAGIDPIAATKTAGMVLALLTTARFVSPVVFGIIADKIDRAKLLVFSMGLTTTAFLSFGLISNPLGPWMLVVAVMVGLADGAQQISAQSLIAEEAPPHLRGAAMGLFAFVGILSVLVVNLVGGALFDSVSHAAPFVMEGGVTLLFLVLALLQLRKTRRLAA